MMTYVILNVIFMALVAGFVVATGKLGQLRPKPLMATAGILLLLTAVFDSVIIHLGLVTYDLTKIAGIYIGKAPIEDFAYTLVAVILVPILWMIFGAQHESKK